MTQRAKLLKLAAVLLFCAAATEPRSDPLDNMYRWFNSTFRQPSPFTAGGFRAHLTEDASLIVNGVVVAKGVQAWASHFQRLKEEEDELEALFPFQPNARAGDVVHTYHLVRRRSGASSSCALTAGYAELRQEKIASLVLIRAPAPASLALPSCGMQTPPKAQTGPSR